MNRSISLLTFLLTAAIPGFSQCTIPTVTDNDGLARYKHFEEVDSIVETNFYAEETEGEIKKGEEKYGKAKTIVVFDKAGKIIELTDYISADEQGNTYQYRYDRQGRIIERTVYYEGKNIYNTLVEYHYDSLIKTHTSVDGHQPKVSGIYELDRKNNTAIKKIHTASNDSVFTFFDLDSAGRVIKERNSYIAPNFSESYEYNDKGELVMEYQITAMPQGKKWIRKTFRNTYRYDDYFNVLEIRKTSNTSTKIIRNEYIYDQHNNWIQRIKYEDDKPTTITSRQIVYRH